MVEHDPNETLAPDAASDADTADAPAEEGSASGVTGDTSGEQTTEAAESAPASADDPTNSTASGEIASSETGSDASSATQETPLSATAEEASTSDSQENATTPAADAEDAADSADSADSDHKHGDLMHPNSVVFAQRGETFKDVIKRAVAELKTDVSDEIEWHKANTGAFQGVDPNLPLPESMRLNVPGAKLHE